MQQPSAGVVPSASASEKVVAGRYEQIRLLGKGGQGEVWEVRDRVTGRNIALKLLAVQAPLAERGRLLFQQEFHALTQLKHPSVVPVIDYGVLDDGGPFFTMELIEGRDLLELGVLDLEHFYAIFMQVAQALAFVHSRGVVHRDIKGSNVRVVEDGETLRVVLLDFGLAMTAGETTDDIAGTISHLPPEAFRGSAFGLRSDLYSLGVQMFMSLVGQAPRSLAAGGPSGRFAVTHIDLTPLNKFPNPLIRLLRSMLAESPANRPASADLVVETLAKVSGTPRPEMTEEDALAYLATPAVVGRTRELNRLREAVDHARAGHVDTVFIEAPTGGGKTRLLEEFALDAVVLDVHVLRARGHRSSATPLSLIFSAFDPLLVARAETDETLAQVGPVLLRAWDRIGDVLPDVREAPPLEDPDAELARILDALEEWLLSVAAEKPMVLCLDDLHFADGHSIDFIDRLLEHSGRRMGLLVVGTLIADRVEEAPGLLELVERHSPSVMRLAPFEAAAVRDLLQKQFPHVPASEDLVRALWVQTGGNPYFLQETLRYLVEEGQIRHIRGRWELPRSLESQRLPQGLSEIVQGRFNACSDGARAVVEALAVAGRPLDLLVLANVMGVDEQALSESIRELLLKDLLQRGEHDLRVRHGYVAQQVADSLDPERERSLHALLADALATVQATEIGGVMGYTDAEIGRHHQLAGSVEAAAGFLVAAGQRAYDLQAHEEAWRILTWADQALLELPYEPGGAVDEVELLLLRLAYYHLEPAEAVVIADRISARIGQLGWLPRLNKLRKWLGRLGFYVAMIATAVQLRRSHAVDKRTFRRLYTILFTSTVFKAAAVGWTGRFRTSRLYAEELQPLIPSDRSAPKALSEAALCAVWALQGSARLVHERLSTARDILVGPEGDTMEVQFHRWSAVVGGVEIPIAASDAIRGLPNALDWLGSTEQVPRDFRSLAMDASRILVLAPYHGLRGELAMLDRELERHQELRVGLRPQAYEIVDQYLARAAVEAGDFDRARTLADGFGEMGLYSKLHRNFILAWCPGSIEERLKLLVEALAMAGDPEIDSGLARQWVWRVEAEVLLEAGRPGDALSRLKRLVESATDPEFVNEYLETTAYRLMAQCNLELAEYGEARSCAARSLQRANALENPLLIGLCHLAVASTDTGDSATVTRHVESAVKMFNRLGNAYQVQRAVDFHARLSPGAEPEASFSAPRTGALGDTVDIDSFVRLTQSLDLHDTAESVLQLVEEILPGSRGTILLHPSADSHEMVFSLDAESGMVDTDARLPPIAMSHVARGESLREDYLQLDSGKVWLYTLQRPAMPGSSLLGGAPFGVICVEVQEPSAMQVALLRRFAQRTPVLAAPLANALEHAHLAQREYRLSMLNQLGQLLNAVRTLQELQRLVLNRMVQVSGADRACLLLMDERSQELRFVMGLDSEEKVLGEGSFRLSDELIEEALNSRAIVEANDREDLSELRSVMSLDLCQITVVPLRSLLEEFTTSAEDVQNRQDTLLSLPSVELTTLVANSVDAGRVIGVIYLETGLRTGPVDTADKVLLRLLSSQAGFAIDSSRLGRQLQEEALAQADLRHRQKQLQRYLSSDVAEAVMNDPSLLVLGGRRETITVLFTDVRGFTAWSGNRESEEVIHTLNEVFSVLTPIIFRHGGTLDKYLGDGLMAIFGAPIRHSDHARSAVLAAREMQEAITGLLQGWAAQGRRVPGMGIGINTGESSVGNIGSEERMEYTAVGDVVNVAARVCGAAGPGQVLMTENTAACLPVGFVRTRALQPVKLKGKDKATLLLELL